MLKKGTISLSCNPETRRYVIQLNQELTEQVSEFGFCYLEKREDKCFLVFKREGGKDDARVVKEHGRKAGVLHSKKIVEGIADYFALSNGLYLLHHSCNTSRVDHVITIRISRCEEKQYNNNVKKQQEEKLEKERLKSTMESRIKSLEQFTPEELMKELARRGYKGNLSYTQTIDICNL